MGSSPIFLKKKYVRIDIYIAFNRDIGHFNGSERRYYALVKGRVRVVDIDFNGDYFVMGFF